MHSSPRLNMSSTYRKCRVLGVRSSIIILNIEHYLPVEKMGRKEREGKEGRRRGGRKEKGRKEREGEEGKTRGGRKEKRRKEREKDVGMYS